MEKRKQAERQLLFCLGTLDYFKNSVFDDGSINHLFLEKIISNLSEVYNYVQNNRI